MGKKFLVGLRENALRGLKDQGMLVDPLDRAMDEDVMPWLLGQMAEFIDDEELHTLNADDVIRDAFEMGKA